MVERYDVAAGRHLRVARHLERHGEIDDAAYHYGVVGEVAVKHALRASGVESRWQSLKETPMRGHFPSLQSKVSAVRADIAAFATGRLAGPIQREVLGPAFAGRYAGWHIDIRYADDALTPVDRTRCAAWARDAEALILALVI